MRGTFRERRSASITGANDVDSLIRATAGTFLTTTVETIARKDSHTCEQTHTHINVYEDTEEESGARAKIGGSGKSDEVIRRNRISPERRPGGGSYGVRGQESGSSRERRRSLSE